MTCYQRCKGKNFLKVLKDVNFYEINRESKYHIVRLPNKNKNYLNKILKEDSKFLASQGIMDYSLLLVTERLPQKRGKKDESTSIGQLSQ